MKDEEDGNVSFFPHQILDFTLATSIIQPVPSRTFPAHPLNYTFVLGRESETRYVHR